MNRKVLVTLAVLVVFLCSMQVAFAAEPSNNHLPNVKILATGGTIAGSGATSTTTVGYTAAVAPVDALINNVPELKKVANYVTANIEDEGIQFALQHFGMINQR